MQIENLLSEKNSPNKETHFIKSRSFLSNDSFFKFNLNSKNERLSSILFDNGS